MQSGLQNSYAPPSIEGQNQLGLAPGSSRDNLGACGNGLKLALDRCARRSASVAYESACDVELTEYLQERAMHYGIEHRWSESMFWKRRAYGPTTGSGPKVSAGSHSGKPLIVSGTTHPM